MKSRWLNYLEQDGIAPATCRMALTILAIVLIWQWVATTLVHNAMLLASPVAVWHALVEEYRSGHLWDNTVATSISLTVAFPLSVLLGVFIGLALNSSRLLSLMLGPVIAALSSIPIIAIAPLLVAWLGLGYASKIILIIMVALFPIIVTTESALNAADKDLIEASRSFNASGWQVFHTVTFPYAVSFIIGGIRVAWARALVGVVVAEFFGSFAGYGYAIMAAGQNFDTAKLLAYVFVLGIFGLIGTLLLGVLEKRLAPWRYV
ncbi:ABC transporter permease [Martelella alba]|uniref:ABC transporter permease n=1 Tax=Martelella alba TaxID=2590451 RepID=A0ABY2SIC5_9HYPH|nr:ABC transporter permease [Martelella alba]TKI04294.1 ABC transporter permease [Martelella alba]